MSRRSGEKIRALYVDQEPSRLEFARLVRENFKNLDITTTPNSQEVIGMLRRGYDCLILDVRGDRVGGQEIARMVRSGGYSSLPIIIQSRLVETTSGVDGRGVFYDEQRGSHRVEELAATLLRLGEGAPAKVERKKGVNAPIGD